MTKPKLVNWELIEDSEIYDLVNDLIQKYHSGGETNISNLCYVLMWKHNIKPDQDGFVRLATISKSNDQIRELRPHDVIIGINKYIWEILNDNQKMAVLDSQLERVAVSIDKKTKIIKEDDRGRTIYRLRRPEVLDEQTLTRRHNTTLQAVQEFAYEKLQVAGAEKGSYIAEVLTAEE